MGFSMEKGEADIVRRTIDFHVDVDEARVVSTKEFRQVCVSSHQVSVYNRDKLSMSPLHIPGKNHHKLSFLTGKIV